MARAAVPLSVDDSKRAIRHIFPKLGGVDYSDGLRQSRRLKWMSQDAKKIQKLSKQLNEMGINHQVIEPQDYNHWRGTGIAIHVSKALNYREAIAGLVNPNKVKQPKRNTRFTSLQTKHRILEKLLPYVTKDDEALSTLELVQVIHDRVKEDLS